MASASLLDPNTLLFGVSLLGFVTSSLTLGLARAAAPLRQAVRAWSCGMLCVGTTFLIVFFRDRLSPFFLYVVANALILAFPIFTSLAYRHLFRLSARVGALRALFAVQFASLPAFYLLGTSRDVAVVTLCSSLTVEFLMIAWLLFRKGVEVPRSIRWMAAGTMALLALLFAIRVVATLAGASPSIDPGAQSTVQIATLLVMSVVLVGSTISFVLMVHDREHKTALEVVRRDDLTGLYTRRVLFDELARAQASPAQSMALVMIDIDHFKHINDRHGHVAGDAVLASVGALIHRSIRADDIAGRYGGEEFCVLLRNCDAAHAERFCERLVRAAAQQQVHTPSGEEIAFTISAGCAYRALPAGPVHDAVTDVLARADAALYSAKNAGRNRVVVASREASDLAGAEPVTRFRCVAAP